MRKHKHSGLIIFLNILIFSIGELGLGTVCDNCSRDMGVGSEESFVTGFSLGINVFTIAWTLIFTLLTFPKR
jgi:hypothetical protein